MNPEVIRTLVHNQFIINIFFIALHVLTIGIVFYLWPKKEEEQSNARENKR